MLLFEALFSEWKKPQDVKPVGGGPDVINANDDSITNELNGKKEKEKPDDSQ